MSSQPTDRTKREFFPQLTSVRFFAAFIVVCYHYKKELTPHLPTVLGNIVNHGYVGVSFFFLLSGFILGANYYQRMLDRQVSKRDFWWARFSRIYPVYLLSILIFLPRFLLPVASDPFPEQAIYAHAHPIQTVSVSLFLLQTFATPAGSFLNSPTWSISTEVFFYLFLPFLIPAISKIRSNWLFQSIVGLFLLAGVGPYLYHGHIFSEGLSRLGVDYNRDLDNYLNQLVRMSFLTRLPEFLIGVLGYRLYREVLEKHHQKWIYIVGIPASIPFLFVMLFESESRVLDTVLYSGQFTCIPFFLMILLGLIGEDAKPLAFLKTPIWVLLGEASFSLYLFHIPIKNFGQFALGKILHVPKENLWASLALMSFSVLISIPIFIRLETPTRKKLTTWYKNRKSPPSA